MIAAPNKLPNCLEGEKNYCKTFNHTKQCIYSRKSEHNKRLQLLGKRLTNKMLMWLQASRKPYGLAGLKDLYSSPNLWPKSANFGQNITLFNKKNILCA
jgi:hypothetical protein